MPAFDSSTSTDRALGEALARRTLDLCRIRSATGEERAIADRAETWARPLFENAVERIGNSLVLGRPGSDGRQSVGLFGHLDTVPPSSSADEPHLEPDRVVGLGASDMKGGLAVLELLAERGALEEAPFDVVAVMYEREEGPYTESGLGPLFEKRPDLSRLDFALCLEPTDNAIQMGCCGSIHATVTFEGISAHSARPWQGENAIHKAGPLLVRLRERTPVAVEVQGLRFWEAMSATVVRGGRARNVVPDELALNLNYRFAPSKSLDEAQEELKRFVGTQAQVLFTDLAPAAPVFRDHPLLRRLQETTGAPIESKQAWTDVARLGLHGVPAVNFGPGHGAQAHQAAEYVDVASLVRGYRLLERFLHAG